MNVTLFDNDGQAIDMEALAKEIQKEERKTNDNIRKLGGDSEVVNEVEQGDLTTIFKDED